jgi:arylsulfatase
MWQFLLACDPGGTTPPAEVAEAEAGGVIVIHVDTLRREQMTTYGYARDTTPLLAARDWMIVDGLRAASGWTMPSTAALLTGLEPQHNGMRYAEGPKDMPTLEVTSFAERLHDLGWSTAMFTGNIWASDLDGLDRGFSSTALVRKGEAEGPNSGALFAEALDWLAGRDPAQPFLLHIQPMDVHGPYQSTPEDLAAFRTEPMPLEEFDEGGWDDEQLADAWEAAETEEERAAIAQAGIDAYDAALLGLDRQIGAFLDELDEQGLLPDTLVVLAADHGESLDESGQGFFGHHHGLREELTRLPWMMLRPDLEPGRVTCLSSNVDVWPTILPLLGVPVPEGLDGYDLGTGCRETARGSLYDSEGSLTWVYTAAESAALKRDCASGRTTGTAIGDGADATERTRAEEMEGGEALVAALDGFSDELAALGLGEPGCPAHEPAWPTADPLDATGG